MILRRLLHIIACFLLLLLALTQSSCEKFKGSQTIPSYLKIDSISLSTDYSIQGTARHNITDAWVYIDGELIGTFQMPVKFPVLKEGLHSLLVLPGIKKDGIAATRITYPFYKEITRNITLTQDETLNLGTLPTTYTSKAKFIWKEDFDDIAVSIDSTNISTEKIRQTPTSDPQTLEGLHSGIISLDSAGATFGAVSHLTYPIPSSEVYMEMNFNMNTEMTIGVYVTQYGIVNQIPIMTLNPTNGAWKKIYIDMTTALNILSGATTFRVYFYSKNLSGNHYTILLDNIKVLSF